MQWSMQIINMHDSESIYPRQFLAIFLFSLSRHLWWYLLFLHTFFFFSSPREIARSGHTTERWKCVLSICTAYVASDATRTRCHVDAHLSVKASCALCPFKRTFVALVANISLFFFHERAMWPRNCAEWNSSRVLRTGHAHASAKNRGSCEAKFFHEITLFIDRRPLFILTCKFL